MVRLQMACTNARDLPLSGPLLLLSDTNLVSSPREWISGGLDLRPGTGWRDDEAAHVVEHAGLRFRLPPPPGQEDDRLLYLGDDEEGVTLEVMAVELEDGALFVIHAMPLRKKYRAEYEEAKIWRV